MMAEDKRPDGADLSRSVFRSRALDLIPEPDFADMQLLGIGPEGSIDPRRWAEAIFSIPNAPIWVRALLGLRQIAVRVIGVAPAHPSVFEVTEVVGEEAVVAAEDRHLDFVAAVGVDPERRIVRVTTSVRLKGWRGRVYFAPTRMLHGAVTRAMMRRAAQRMQRNGLSG